MNRVCLVYFSPTGGTELIARTAAAALAAELKLPLEEFDLTLPPARERELHFSAEDMLVLACPTYAGRIPNKILPELERIVHGDGKTLALMISVYGGRSNDEGLRELVFVGEKNGLVCIGAASCVARHSMSRILASHRPSQEDLREIESFAAKLAEKALKEPTAAPIDRDTPIAPYYRPFKEDMSPAVFLKAKPLTHLDRCISCGLCAASCPMASISFEDNVTVTGVCIKCHACVRKCPTGAKYFDNDELLSHIRVLEKLFKGEQDNVFIM